MQAHRIATAKLEIQVLISLKANIILHEQGKVPVLFSPFPLALLFLLAGNRCASMGYTFRHLQLTSLSLGARLCAAACVRMLILHFKIIIFQNISI